MKLALLIVEGLSLLIACAGCDGAASSEPQNMTAVAAVSGAVASMVAVDTVPAPQQRCGGTKFITHGDGHKTPCPGCQDCTGAAASVCQCGPDCVCKTTPNNPACRCDKCQCDPKPAFVPVPEAIGDGVEGPAPFSGLVCVMDNGPCVHCVSQQPVLASMKGWDIKVLYEGEQQALGLPTPYGYPTFYVLIDGKPVRMHVGFLSANEIADLNGGHAFGTTAAKSRPVRRTMSYCPSCR